MRKVVVAGSSGLLGKRLVNRLLMSHIPILGIDPGPSPFEIDGYQHVQSSISKAADLIVDHLQGGGVYYHMAGLADMKQCEEQPAEAFAQNVALVFVALSICERVGDVRFVFPSTGMVYGFNLSRPAIEDDPILPGNLYTSSKLAAEMLVRSYSPDRIKNGVVVARLSNVYGPNASENTVLGRLLGQISRQESLQVFDERPVRDFIHVDDAVEALDHLGQADIHGALIVNVSNGRGIKIGDAVEMLSVLSGLPHDTSEVVIREPATHLVLSNALLQKTTGWIPQIHLEQGLQLCLDAICFS